MAGGQDVGITTSTSALLTMPPELRNIIYRYILVEEKQLYLSRRSWVSHQRPLPQICRQVRDDAFKLFYTLKEFGVENKDCDASVLHHLSLLSKRNNVSGMKYYLLRSEQPSWVSLKAWVKQYHSLKNVGLFYKWKTHTLEHVVVGTVFQTAKQCRDMAWGCVKKLVDVHHHTLIKIDPRWE